MYEKLKNNKTSKEYEEWFLKYVPKKYNKTKKSNSKTLTKTKKI